ncbi:MAG: hypothetical protein RLZZ200_523 [Pseudomonadota bacterium]|jgi:hypothetical protein
MITITQRDCRLGPKFAGKHNEAQDAKPESRTLKVQLEGIEVDEAEFNALFQDAHAWQLLHGTDGPSLRLLKKFELKGLKFEGAHVVLYHSLGAEMIEIKQAKISKVTLHIADEEASGATTLSLTVDGEPPLNAKLVKLIERIGNGIEVEIRADHPEAQKDLPLNTHGTGEQPATGKPGRRARSGRGRNRSLN